jgi:hypothetical protein
MWTYIQHTGELLLDNQHVDNGYSGFGDGKNNPDMEGVEDAAPFPMATGRSAARLLTRLSTALTC